MSSNAVSSNAVSSNAVSSNEPGTVLLRSRFRPLYAVNILVTGAVFLIVALDGLFFQFLVPLDEGTMMKGALMVVLAIGLVATAQGAVQLVRPQVLIEATDRGLVLYRQSGAPRDKGGTLPTSLVPWSHIRSLRYEVHALPTGIRRAKTETIALRLVEGKGLSAEHLKHLREGFSHLLKELPSQDPDTVYVDAGSGEPGGRELLAELERLRAEHG